MVADPDLTSLAAKYGTDKGESGHFYTQIYDELLGSRRTTARAVLEIGVFQGASLHMWRDYFSEATIYGMDYADSARRFESDRIRIVVGDQSNPTDLARASTNGPFDLIIDDGSHAASDQLISFEHLFASLSPGGIYICEDLQAQLKGQDRFGQRGQATFDFFFKACLEMQASEASGLAQITPDVAHLFNTWQREIASISFYRFLLVVTKRRGQTGCL